MLNPFNPNSYLWIANKTHTFQIWFGLRTVIVISKKTFKVSFKRYKFKVDVEIEFEAFCDRCGAGLCGNITEGRTTNRQFPFIRIEPCQKCLDSEYDRGLEDGKEVE